MTYDLNTLIQHQELPLAHRIRSPSSGSTKNSSCLILLHGVGANELGFVELAARLDSRLTVILVRSPIEFGLMQFGFFQVSFTPSGPVINAEQAEHSRGLLANFIEKLPGVYGVAPQNIWMAGFSQGGILSASVGLTRPDLIRGFGILSGRILPEISPKISSPHKLEKLHAFVSHGINDSKLELGFARRSRELLNRGNMELTYREYLAGHEFSSEMQNDFCRWITEELQSV